MKNDIPTAEDFLHNYPWIPMYEEVKEVMIAFAKLHVKASLEAAANNVKTKEKRKTIRASHGSEIHTIIIVDKDSILNAYPENLIQ